MAGRILDKTITSFEEATGRIEDAIGWVEKAKKKVYKASNDLCKEVFDVGKK